MTISELTEVYGEPISVYTLQNALDDGMLVQVGKLANLNIPVVFTSNLFTEVKDHYQDIVTKGLELLNKKDEEDDDNYRLRVIEKDRIWVIANSEGVTFMKPEDY
ncbi:MAG: hypothetical protein WCW44_00090 [archaeon]|jgi:hypothetical protein